MFLVITRAKRNARSELKTDFEWSRQNLKNNLNLSLVNPLRNHLGLFDEKDYFNDCNQSNNNNDECNDSATELYDHQLQDGRIKSSQVAIHDSYDNVLHQLQDGNIKSSHVSIHDSYDNVLRIDSTRVSKKEFIKKFEKRNIPVVITGCTTEWPAQSEWTIENLYKKYKHEKFKVGEDDNEKVVFMSLQYYLQYATSDPYGAALDDSPLYIFDATFGKRKLHHSFKKMKKENESKTYNPEKSQSTVHLVEDYRVPEYFQDDLFQLVGGRRPPFRWIVIGPARSGTGIHLDPLGKYKSVL